MLLLPLALLLFGCSLGIQEGAPELAVRPTNLPLPTTTPVAQVVIVDANAQSTRVALSGLEGTTVALQATTQSMEQRATLDAAAAIHAADSSTATAIAIIPIMTEQAIATQQQVAVYAQETSQASMALATQTSAASTQAAATAVANELAVQETAVAIQSTAAVVSSFATQEAQRVIIVAEQERLRAQQQQIAIERSIIVNKLLTGSAVVAPILLLAFIAFFLYRERKQLVPQVNLNRVQVAVAAPPIVERQSPAIVIPAKPGLKSDFEDFQTNHIIAPEWQSLFPWRGDGLPLGVGHSGLLTAATEHNPHLMFVGRSGSSLTRHAVKPLVAAALGNRWHVSVLDLSGWDYLPFDENPNASLMIVNSARDAVAYLQTVCEEVQLRLHLLQSARKNGWPLPHESERPRSLIAIDQFAKIAGLLDNKGRAEMWRSIRTIAAKGHHVGIHLAIAFKDPTPASFDPNLRQLFSFVAFTLGDEQDSNLVLGRGGAESLPERHFMAMLPQLVRGVSFSPSDTELQVYLAQNRCREVDAPIWTRTTRSPVTTPSNRSRTTEVAFGALPIKTDR